MSVLQAILKDVREDIRRREKAKPVGEMNVEKFQKRSIAAAIQSTAGVPVIAEIKRASPSAGSLKLDADVVLAAEQMVRGGAAALSVLTEQKHFKGDPNFLTLLRETTGVPLLRKDFIVGDYQIYEAADLGADAVLLIAKVLGENLWKHMVVAEDIGLECLVEVENEDEVELAESVGASFIGINNRDLDTLEVDLGRTERLAPLISDSTTLVSESGITSPADVRKVMEAGADAVLVGTAIMRSSDIEKAVRSLVDLR
ncbi:MAG: indole-3-glycerol phosphate synthase TrpC [Candidatus Hadarchaeota archaeon]